MCIKIGVQTGNPSNIFFTFSNCHNIFFSSRFITRYMYHPPEYFGAKSVANIRGELYDIWSFAILTLNVLTGLYYYRKTSEINGKGVHWWTQLLPIINKALDVSYTIFFFLHFHFRVMRLTMHFKNMIQFVILKFLY